MYHSLLSVSVICLFLSVACENSAQLAGCGPLVHTDLLLLATMIESCRSHLSIELRRMRKRFHVRGLHRSSATRFSFSILQPIKLHLPKWPMILSTELASAYVPRPGQALSRLSCDLETPSALLPSTQFPTQLVRRAVYETLVMERFPRTRNAKYRQIDDETALIIEDITDRQEPSSHFISPFLNTSPTELNFQNQTSSILKAHLLRWLFTAAIPAAILATLRVYQGKGNVNSAQKNVCTNVVLALILLLGLNFFVN